MTTRYCRVRVDGVAHAGRLEGERVVLLSRAPWLPGPGAAEELGEVALPGAELLAPAEPSKIVAIGQNYASHAREMGKPVPEEPLIFLKAPSALNGPLQPIVLPPASSDVQHEGELAVLIGRRLHHAGVEEAEAALFGFACFNDVTARDIQRREIQHTRAKSYDTFACLGPWWVCGLDVRDLEVVCRVNAQVRQQGRTSDMVFSPARLVAFISTVMTLHPGDVVSTGTPAGVGRLRSGDRVEVDIEGIGVLLNPVVEVA